MATNNPEETPEETPLLPHEETSLLPEKAVTPEGSSAETPKPDAKPMKRIFVYDGREFPDPDPKMTVEEVRQYYATFMPELSNATTSETTRPVKGTNPPEQERVITFTKRVGTKGKKTVPASTIDEAEFKKSLTPSGETLNSASAVR